MSNILADNMLQTSFGLCDGQGRPRNTDLRRAISTAYYAMFHTLCANIADMLVGGVGADKSDPAWKQIYRALEHRKAKDRCQKIIRHQQSYGFPTAIKDFSQTFMNMQELRTDADYNPEFSLGKTEVIDKLNQVKLSMEAFNDNAVSDKDRTAFAVWLLFGKRD